MTAGASRADNATETTGCRNCGVPLGGDYCARCGQARAERLTVKGMFRRVTATVLDLERGFGFTVRALSTRPGETCRGYVDGRRQPLTGPMKYCFIMVTIYALTANFLEIEIRLPGDDSLDEIEQRLFYLINSLLGYLIFFILVPVAVIQRRLFRGHGDTLGETYAFQLYTTGHASWFSVLFASAGWLGGQWGLLTLMIVNVAYITWALTGFYGLSARPPLLRGVAMTLVGVGIANVVALAVANLTVYLGLLEPLAAALA